MSDFMEEEVKEKKQNKSLLGDLIEEANPLDSVNGTLSSEVRKNHHKDAFFYEIIGLWSREKKSDQFMKLIICSLLVCILVGEIIFIDILVYLIGKGVLKFDEWTIRLFIAGVFTEIAALVKMMMGNLFPVDEKKDFMNFIKTIDSNNSHNVDDK